MAVTVNEIPYDFGSISIKIGVVEIPVKGVGYGEGMETEKPVTSKRRSRQRTQGVYNAEDATITLLVAAEKMLLKTLGNGYMMKKFPVAGSYAHPGEPLQTFELEDCRIVGRSKDHSQGPEGLETELTLSVMRVKEDGLYAVEDT